MERELDQVTKQQKTQQKAFQTVQDQNNEKLSLLRDEIRLTQESVEKIKEDNYTHISHMLERIYTLEDAFRCYQFESAYRHFLQSSQLYLSHIGTLYTHFKTFRAAFYAYRNNFFSIISSLAAGHITPQFVLPTQLATNLQKLAAEEFRKISKLTPAISSGFEATHYDLQIVLVVTMLPKGISFVLSIPIILSLQPTTFSKPNFHINPMMTAKRHPFTTSQTLRCDCNTQHQFCRVSRVYATTMNGE